MSHEMVYILSSLLQFQLLLMTQNLCVSSNPSHSFSQPGSSPCSSLVIATTSWRQSATNTSVRAWTQPRVRTCPRPQSLTASLVRSTPVRWLYVSSKMDERVIKSPSRQFVPEMVERINRSVGLRRSPGKEINICSAFSRV